MSREFSLAGLLRLRHLQQDEAAGHLASANARLDSTSVQRNRASAALGATRADVSEHRDPLRHGGRARIHAQHARRSRLDDLTQQHEEAAEANEAFSAARAKAVALEKLEAKHIETEKVEELRAEQSVIDELACTSWHADQEGTRS